MRESTLPDQTARAARSARAHHNAQLAEYCRREGLPLVDLWSRLSEQHLGDELHPNEAGARVIAAALFQALAETC